MPKNLLLLLEASLEGEPFGQEQEWVGVVGSRDEEIRQEAATHLPQLMNI